MDSSTMLVGERNGEAAQVYLFDGATWTHLQTLTSPDGVVGDTFGEAVCIHGSVAVVGAPLDDDAGDESGSAYVFRLDGTNWVFEQKLVASDAGEADRFGKAVAVRGNQIVVGAVLHDGSHSDFGAAYAFVFDGSRWVERQILLASDASQGAQFGAAISMWEEALAIGAAHDGGGAAYIFRHADNGWTQEQKLIAADPATDERFGADMAIAEDLLIVGADNDGNSSPGAGDGSGAAYIFRFNGNLWVQEQKLTALDGAAGHHFGSAVSLEGSLALIGAYRDETAGPETGSAYAFACNGETWIQEQKLIAVDSSFGQMGFATALRNEDGFVGAPFAGAVYEFTDVASIDMDCNSNTIEDACEIAALLADDINENGVPDECDIARGDFNLDGVVNVVDLVLVIANWGPCAPACTGDANGDGLVNVQDLVVVVTNWG